MSDTEAVNRIRKRKSYKYWKKIAKTLSDCKNTRKRLLVIYHFLDGMKAFGSYTMACYALESLNQVIEDEGLHSSKG